MNKNFILGPNPVLMDYKGIWIFRIFRREAQSLHPYLCGVACDSVEYEDKTTFDVTQLPTWKGPTSENLRSNEHTLKQDALFKQAIAEAIDQGLFLPYIEAAGERWKCVRLLWHNPNVNGKQDVYSYQSFAALIDSIQFSILDRVDWYYHLLTHGKSHEIKLVTLPILYQEGADYTITGLSMVESNGQYILKIIQNEEGGPHNEPQNIEYATIEVLAKILKSLESLYGQGMQNAVILPLEILTLDELLKLRNISATWLPTIILYHNDYGYVITDESAKLASKLAHLTLHNHHGIELVFFPSFSLDRVLQTLISSGYLVGICERLRKSNGHFRI